MSVNNEVKLITFNIKIDIKYLVRYLDILRRKTFIALGHAELTPLTLT